MEQLGMKKLKVLVKEKPKELSFLLNKNSKKTCLPYFLILYFGVNSPEKMASSYLRHGIAVI